MRVQKTADGLTVQGIGGTHVVLLGWDFPKANCDGLAGFAVHRTDHAEQEAYWLRGMKTFKATDPGLPRGSLHSTREHPVQSFMWSDYSAKPGRKYTYRVLALKGDPAHLEPVAETSVEVRTEAPEDGLDDVHFNRGAAASQEYARRFGNRRPDEANPDDPLWAWLSRGLFEAMTEFVDAANAGDKLRVCAYEFHSLPFLRSLKAALDRGVDVRIIYDAKDNPDSEGKVFPRDANRAAALATGLAGVCIERAAFKSAISHNKFIVRFRGDQPASVWTGGTNFSTGGIFGHSNVGQVAEYEDVATAYAAYWTLLAGDPTGQQLRPKVDALTPVPAGLPPAGTSAIFSPRGSLEAIEWYAVRAKAAEQGLFMSFAFGMNDIFKDVYRTCAAPLRFALMEAEVRAMKAGPEKDQEVQAIRDLRLMDENLFAIGAHFRANKFDAWLAEKLTELNSHVRYVHNKFMLIDPLSEDPIVVGGSANFS